MKTFEEFDAAGKALADEFIAEAAALQLRFGEKVDQFGDTVQASDLQDDLKELIATRLAARLSAV